MHEVGGQTQQHIPKKWIIWLKTYTGASTITISTIPYPMRIHHVLSQAGVNEAEMRQVLTCRQNRSPHFMIKYVPLYNVEQALS